MSKFASKPKALSYEHLRTRKPVFLEKDRKYLAGTIDKMEDHARIAQPSCGVRGMFAFRDFKKSQIRMAELDILIAQEKASAAARGLKWEW